MSETGFSVNDLLRRKLQTSFVVASLTICVASTLSLLLIGEDLGIGLFSATESRLTLSLAIVFSRFITFIGFLIFIVGIVVTSFMTFVMMAQRIKDIGLMKAVGCPNDLVFGYFMNELVLVMLFSCVCGVFFGILTRSGLISLFNAFGSPIAQKPINIWLIITIFVGFLVLGLVVGAKPVLDATKVEAVKAMSPLYHLGLSKELGFSAASKSTFAMRMALRSLFRRKAATLRIIICLATVFMLVTVTVASGLIASQTSADWVERAIGRNVAIIGHREMVAQYKMLLSKFSAGVEEQSFSYSADQYLIPNSLLDNISLIEGISPIDARLVLVTNVREIRGYYIDPDTAATVPVGDNRTGDSIVVGLNPEKVVNSWLMEGMFINESHRWQAAVADSLSKTMFSMPTSQGLRMFNRDFDIVGTCLEPLNNGNAIYVSLSDLMNATGLSGPNIALVRINQPDKYAETLSRLRDVVSVNSGFEVSYLNEVLDKNLGFLFHTWLTVMLLPLCSLASVIISLTGYVVLAISEQHQEFGILRAIGAKPKAIVRIISMQNAMVLLAGYGVGIAFGTIATLMILVQEPVVTSLTILEIVGLMLAALILMFVFSLYPALRFSKKPIIETMASA